MTRATETREDKERGAKAYCYVGQLQLLAGHEDKAIADFREVVKTRIADFVEYNGAKAERCRLER